MITDKVEKDSTEEKPSDNYGEEMIADKDIIEESSSDNYGEEMVISKELFEIRVEKRVKEVVKEVFEIMKVINSARELVEKKGYKNTAKILDTAFMSLFKNLV